MRARPRRTSLVDVPMLSVVRLSVAFVNIFLSTVVRDGCLQTVLGLPIVLPRNTVVVLRNVSP